MKTSTSKMLQNYLTRIESAAEQCQEPLPPMWRDLVLAIIDVPTSERYESPTLIKRMPRGKPYTGEKQVRALFNQIHWHDGNGDITGIMTATMELGAELFEKIATLALIMRHIANRPSSNAANNWRTALGTNQENQK